jgi:outer membrane protein assembly factor BamB
MTPHARGAIAAGVALLALAAGAAGGAAAQSFDVQRPRTLVIGTPAGGARADRLDAARSGLTRSALPTSSLRTEWRTPVGALLERAPLVDASGGTVVVGTRGEVVALARDGSERWRVSTSAMQPGPPVLLSDDTVVFVDAAGEAVAVRDGALRWRVRFGRPDAAHPAPVPLDDGGVVVATTHEMAALDADGNERARATIPEPTATPLVSALGKVVAVTTSGAVWTWAPGAPEAARVGSFGSPIDGGAVLADARTLLAVTAGQQHLAALDLVRGTTATRAVSPAALWMGPPAARGGVAYLLALGPTSELAMALDASGAELARALLATRPPPISIDGGAATLVTAPHTGPIVDAAGTVAFATTDGNLGVVAGMTSAGGSVELLSDACPAPLSAGGSARAVAPVVGLAPLGAGAFVAACHGGTVLAVRGAAGGGERASSL